MKKFFAFLLSAAMLFGLVAVPAAADGEVTITVATVDEVTPGTDVFVDIMIGGAEYEAHTLTFNVLFNSEMLTYKSATPGEVWNSLPMDAMKYCNSEVAGQVGVGIVCPTDAFSGLGKLVSLKFHVAENCTENQPLAIEISLMSYAPTGVEPVEVPVVGVDGAINIVEQPEPPVQEINEIYIEGFTAPVWGEHPDYEVNVPADAHYTIDYVDWNWWDDIAEDGDVIDASATFNREDVVYYMYFEIVPAEGFAIDPYATVCVNGDPSIIETKGLSTEYGYYWAYTIDYTVTDPGGDPPTPPSGELDAALNVEGGTLHFESEGAYPWTTATEGSRTYAVSTNNGISSSESVMSMTFDVPANKAISFDYKAWGEGSGTPWDKCIFAIDGNAQFTYGAVDNDWTNFTVNVSAGVHTFTWTYSKDSSVDPNGDYFAVDNVEFKEREEQPVDDELNDALNVEGGDIQFVSVGTYPWIVIEGRGRTYAMSGNQGIGSSTSELTATVIANEGDIVQFEFKAWGEGEGTFWDHCDFYVDGARVLYYGAYDNEWETFHYILTAGEHLLKWSYTKDSSVDPNGDYFAVDNVYVGEPVHVASITCDEAIEVPVSRTGLIHYEVLPAEAANKAVTFTSADTSIATVNERGVVVGVAEGVTTVTITSVDNPDVTATCEVTVIDTGLTAAQFYGIAAYDLAEVYTDQWVTFADYDVTTVSGLGSAPDSYAAAYAYGNVYGYTTGGDFYVAPFGNLANYSVVASGAYTDGTIVSMAYNYADGIMYGLDSTNNMLVAIDIDSGYAEAVGYFTAADVIAIAITDTGVGYAISFDGNLYRFDPATGACTVVGATGCNVNYVQDMCYDYNNGDLYWAQIYSASSASFYRVDKNTGMVEDLGQIGGSGMEICGLFVVPNYEPDRPTDIPVTGVQINPTEVEIRVGEMAHFTAIVSPINASNKNVEWAVDEESVIAVDQNGTVLGLEVGTAMVFCTTEDGAHTAFATVNVLPPLGNALTGYFFETNPLNDGWQFVDYDGDGYNWGWDNSTYTPYEGSGLIYSASYDNPTYSALNPDNWAISPAIILPSENADVTLYAMGQDPDYASEVFAIYAGTSPDVSSMVKVAGDFTATGSYVQYGANLGAFVGQTVYVAIRHYNVSDQFILNVDQVEFWGTGSIDGAHTLTINYLFEDGSMAAPSYNGMFTEGATYSVTSPTINGYIPDMPVVTGTMGDQDIMIDVTYSEDPNAAIAGWFFETSPYNEGWQFIDDDGDGYNWIWQQDYSNPPYCTAYEGEGLIHSDSYDNDTGAVLYPDNWAVSPAVQLPTGSAYVTLYACGQDANYAAEHFAIYAGTSGDIYDMVQISQEFVATGDYVQYRADLTAFLGETVYIAIRHFNIADMFMLNVDQVEVFGAAGEPTPTEPVVTPEPTEPVVTPEPTQPADPTVTFTIGTVYNAQPGQEVLVPVMITGNKEYEAHVLTMHVTYDPSKLTVTGYTAGDLFYTLPMDASKVFDYATNPGDFSIGIICPTDGFTGSGTLLNIKFRVADDCTQDQPVNATVPEFTYSPLSGGITEIPYVIVPGAVNLSSEPVVTPAPTEPVVTPAPTEPVVTPEPTEPVVTPEPTEPVVTPEPTEPEPTEPAVGSAVFTVESKDGVKPGDTFTLDFTVSGEYEANCVAAYITWDSTALSLVEAAPGAIGGVFTEIPAGDGNERVLMYVNEADMSGEIVLGTLTFTAADNFAEATVVAPTIEQFGIMDDEVRTFVDVPYTLVNGVVTPAGTTPVVPPTGAISLAGLGIIAIATGAGIVLFRKKED